jgi:hypothetical protein
MNFATATPQQLAAAGYAFKTIRRRAPRKGELIFTRVGGSAAVSVPSNENRPDTQPNWFYMGR